MFFVVEELIMSLAYIELDLVDVDCAGRLRKIRKMRKS